MERRKFLKQGLKTLVAIPLAVSFPKSLQAKEEIDYKVPDIQELKAAILRYTQYPEEKSARKHLEWIYSFFEGKRRNQQEPKMKG